MQVSVKTGQDAVDALRMMPAKRLKASLCIVVRNPFDPDDHLVEAIVDELPLSEIAKRFGVDPKARPVIAKVNGAYVLQREWATTWVDSGSVVEFCYLVQGGSTKDILKAVLLIALVVVAYAVGGPAGGALATATGISFFATAAGAALISATIIAGGALLINAVIPPSKPTVAGLTRGGARGVVGAGGGAVAGVGAVEGPSPTYSVSAQGNAARIGQVIPVLYGRHLVYPDFGSTPWTEFDQDSPTSNRQFLHQMFVISQGEIEIEQYRLGEAQLANFPDVSTEVIEPGGELTLFDPNVYQAREVAGQTLFGTNEDEFDWVGPFPANPPDTVLNGISIDWSFPGGLILNTGGSINVQAEVQGREIDDEGQVLAGSSFIHLGILNVTQSTTSAIRISKDYATGSGSPTSHRWEIRVQRTTVAVLNTPGAVDLLRWEALKGFVDGSFEFGGVTVLATTMKSSDTLNSNTSRLINVIATRKLPTWNGSEWSMPQSSRSIAWAAADVLLNPAYGAGLSDDDIDLDGLLELDAVWSSRGDQFNGVFDQATTVWDALSQILRAGRARAYQQGGKIRFHRDQAQTTPIGMFSLANINLNSFRLEFAFPIPGEAAGGVEGEFFNERTWRPDSVTAGDPEFAHEQLFGITNNTQAQLETDYQERTNRLRRVFCTFETELEGLIPSQGDLILISHDLPQWGFSGDVLSYDASFRIATLSVDVDLDDAFTWTIQFRDARGRPSQQVLIDPLPDANQVQLQTDPTYYDSSDFDVFVGPAQEPTHFIIGRTSREAREAIVTNIVPRTEAVEIQCVLENDDVHVES